MKKLLTRFVWCCLSLTVLAMATVCKARAEAPNVLLILADDCTFSDLAIYGGTNAKTPNIDRLASQGLTFNRAYVSSAMCQPCRAELYTGQFPLRNGCAWNHSACRPGTRSLPQYLKPLGYRTGITGKVHVQPKASFTFESVEGFDSSAVREPTQPHDLVGIREFMNRDKSKPFCLVIGLAEPHVPWVMGNSADYPVKGIKLPPHLADTPKTRQDFASYLAEIAYMDGQVGEILKTLDESGQSESTIVLFSSEQGAQFPGSKWTCWDVGLHTTLIARWPCLAVLFRMPLELKNCGTSKTNAESKSPIAKFLEKQTFRHMQNRIAPQSCCHFRAESLLFLTDSANTGRCLIIT